MSRPTKVRHSSPSSKRPGHFAGCRRTRAGSVSFFLIQREIHLATTMSRGTGASGRLKSDPGHPTPNRVKIHEIPARKPDVSHSSGAFNVAAPGVERERFMPGPGKGECLSGDAGPGGDHR